MQDRTKERIDSLSERLGIDAPILLAQLNAAIEQLKRIYPSWNENQIEDRARHLLASKYSDQMRGSAMTLVGVITDIGPVIDYTENARAMANDAWRTNPQKAYQDGLTDVKGVPLDTRRLFPNTNRRNPNYGKPLVPFEQKTCLGVLTKFGEQNRKISVVTLRGEQAKLEIPLNAPVQLRLNIRGETDTLLICTGSRFTEIEPAVHPLFEDWSEAKTVDLLDKAPIKLTVEDVQDWYDKNEKSLPVIPVILEADLVGKGEEPTRTGSFRCSLGNIESDEEITPLSMFVDEATYKKLIEPLGLSSKLLISGTLGLGQDLATQERTQVIVNPLGIRVKFAVSKEESLLEFPSV